MSSPADDSLDTINIHTGDAACIDDGGITLSHGRAFRVRDPSSVTGSERAQATSAGSVDSFPGGYIALPTEPLSDVTK